MDRAIFATEKRRARGHFRSVVREGAPGERRAAVGDGEFRRSARALRRGHRFAAAIGDDAGAAASLTSLGIILQFRGEYDRALQVHAEALEVRRRTGDGSGIANSLSNLASTAFSKNDLDRAAAYADESVVEYRGIGHESGVAHALMILGLVAACKREYERAEHIFSECLRVQRAVGYTGVTYYSLVNLGAVAHKRGNFDLALARYREAFEMLDTMPSKSAIAKTLEDPAFTLASVGDPPRGVRLLGAADALRRAIGSPLFASERADYDADVARLRALLGDATFDVQWSLGTSLTIERAIADARAAVGGT